MQHSGIVCVCVSIFVVCVCVCGGGGGGGVDDEFACINNYYVFSCWLFLS